MDKNNHLRSLLIFTIVGNIFLLGFSIASYYGKSFFYNVDILYVDIFQSWGFYFGAILLLPLINVGHKFIMQKVFNEKPSVYTKVINALYSIACFFFVLFFLGK